MTRMLIAALASICAVPAWSVGWTWGDFCAGWTAARRADGTVVIRCPSSSEPVVIISPSACPRPQVDRTVPGHPVLRCA